MKNRLEALEREAAKHSQDGSPPQIETGAIDIQEPVSLPVNNAQSSMMFDGLELNGPEMEGIGSFDSTNIGMGLGGTADFYSLANNHSDKFLDSTFNDFTLSSDLLNQTSSDWEMSFDGTSSFANAPYPNDISGSLANSFPMEWSATLPASNQFPESLTAPNSVAPNGRQSQVVRASPVSSGSFKRKVSKPSPPFNNEHDLGDVLIHELRLQDTPEHRSLIKTAVARGYNFRDVMLAGLGALGKTADCRPPPPKIGVNLDIAKMGTLQAYLAIAKAIDFSIKNLYDEAAVSPFYQSSNTTAVVKHRADIFPNLRPTQAQIMYSHHPWLDLIPFPSLRVKILTLGLLDPPPFDVYELKMDIFMNDGITCWRKARRDMSGQPWDMRCWEAEKWFLEKYAFLFGEEDELRAQTKWWRWMRGDGK